jgi:N-acetylmuramoyl-L-alanine amidase/putative methionine-R-sulfoxide reductase with GAF domain
MATTSTKPNIGAGTEFSGVSVPGWPRLQGSAAASDSEDNLQPPTSHRDALQALLAFSSLHDQVRRRRALAAQRNGFDVVTQKAEFEQEEHFLLDEVLRLVAERAVAITGADGLAIALAENNEIVLRASAGTIKPDIGARIDRASAFSGACFRTAQIVRCDDTETDDRVNVEACCRLGARSMVAVPLCGRQRVIGLLEAFSVEPFGFNDSDVRNLSLLAELVLGALKPEDEDRFAESAQIAASKLNPASRPSAVVSAPLPLKTPSPQTPSLQPPLPKTPPPSLQPEIPALQAASENTSTANAQASSAPAPDLLDPPALENPNFFEPEKAPQHQTTPRHVLAEPLAGKHHPGVLLVLAMVVLASLLGVGLWWKLKNAQIGSVMVQSQKPVAKPPDAQLPTPAETKPAPADAAPVQSSTAAPDAHTDPLSDTAEPPNAPASLHDLLKFPRVTGIRHWSSVDSSTVVLDLEDQVQYEAHRLTSPNRIYFDLRDTQLVPELFGKNIEVGDALLNRIRVAQPVPGMTRIVLEIKGNSNFSVSLEPNPYRLVVQLRKIGAESRGAVNLFPSTNDAGSNTLAIIVPPPSKEDLQWRARVPKMRIVVDAGHGGWDLGTVGRGGLLEKDVVLEIAARLGRLLESRLGSEVIYTRQDDNYIPLDERAAMANQAQADLFISVHANYSDLPSARGVETYYTNFFSAPSSKDIEMRENGSKSPVSSALSPVELHERIEQSRRLAASVQHSLYGTLSSKNPGLRDRGVKAAGFVVLTESSMPGILAEVSFVSSPTDEKKLRSDGYREQIAEALYKGIARYAASSHSVKVASAAK